MQNSELASHERKQSCSPHSVRVFVRSVRSVDSPLALLPDSVALEEELSDGQNWQDTVPPQLLATLSPKEVDRQATIYGTRTPQDTPQP